MTTHNSIGLIGVGKMGTGIGQSLLRRGRSVSFYARSSNSNTSSLLAQGAKRAETIADVAENCSALVLCLPSSAEVRDICCGPDGIPQANGSILSLVVDTTTGFPDESVEVAAQLSKRGILYVDAPLTRGPREAAEGRLNAILGGDQSTKAAARAILSDFCEFIVETDGIGSAQKLKLVNNALSMSVVALLAEISDACEKLTVSEHSLRTLASRGGVNSGLLQAFFDWKLENKEDALAFSIGNASKDLEYFRRLAGPRIPTVAIVDAARTLFKSAQSAGLGDLNIPNVIRLLKER